MVEIHGCTTPFGSEVNFSMTSDIYNVCEVRLGVREVLKALNDILTNYEQLSDEDFEKLLKVATRIQNIASLGEAEKICSSCDSSAACENCENFSKLLRYITGV